MIKTQKISGTIIVKAVSRSLARAKKTVLATMDVDKEVKNPLPDDYFQLVKRILSDGVTFYRLGFGTQKSLKIVKKREKLTHTNYLFRHTKSKNHKRMLIIDDTNLFFRKNDQFFSSNDPKIIKKFKKYFQKEWEQAKNRPIQQEQSGQHSPPPPIITN